MQEASSAKTETKAQDKSRWLFLANLSIGHAVTHWYALGFSVILPEIKSGMALNDLQIGTLNGMRAFFGSAINFPAGALSDMFRSGWALLLSLSLVWLAVAYFVVGSAPTYLWLFPALALVGMGQSVWHPPAISAVSQRFPDRRGSAIAIHGVGGSVGDTLGPITLGLLLLSLSWRAVLKLSAIPAILLAAVVWLLLRRVPLSVGKAEKRSMRDYLQSLKGVFSNRQLLIVFLAAGVRGMGHSALFTFLPIYLREDLGYSTAKVGFYLSLLSFMGLVSQPVLGFLSDRVGRKAVLVPALSLLGVLALLLTVAAPGLQFTGVIVAMGLFIYALQAVFLAFAMDLTGAGAEGTTIGSVFAITALLTFPSPIIAGALIESYSIEAIFYYTAGLWFLSAFLLLWLSPGRIQQKSATDAV